jgi:hypothetical protein
VTRRASTDEEVELLNKYLQERQIEP